MSGTYYSSIIIRGNCTIKPYKASPTISDRYICII